MGSTGCDESRGDESFTGLRQVLAAMCDYLDRCPQDQFAFAYLSCTECVDILEFFLSDEGGVNLLEWRYMRVRWDDYRVDGHRFAGAGSYSGRLMVGFC